MPKTEPNLSNPVIPVEYDLSSLLDYNRLSDVLTSTVDSYGTANSSFQALGHLGLSSILSSLSPQTANILKDVKYEVKHGLGAVVLHNTGIESISDQSAQLLSITLSSALGEPTRTDRKFSQIAWSIKYIPDLAITPTFSQTLGEAAYHTDTQYFSKPEEYFGLYCRKADIDGLGTNTLIPLKKIVNVILEKYGRDTIDTLSTNFPFKVPTVFTESVNDKEAEITWAPILTENAQKIRYRKDTIEAALKIPGTKITDLQHVALSQFDSSIKEVDPIRFHLQSGDAMIVNNHQLLHARTAFSSKERWLYRVRMREVETL